MSSLRPTRSCQLVCCRLSDQNKYVCFTTCEQEEEEEAVSSVSDDIFLPKEPRHSRQCHK